MRTGRPAGRGRTSRPADHLPQSVDFDVGWLRGKLSWLTRS